MAYTVEIDLGNGRTISLETGKLAKQANGAVMVRSGESVVLVTACASEKPKPGAAFFPLTVDYREYTYSAGRFPGGFIKREGRPSEKEILTSRLIDRPIRPLFPEDFTNESQIIAMVMSADPQGDPGILAIVGAGAALAISDIPFQHVLAGVRVGMVDGQYVANPNYEEAKNSRINITVAGTEDGIVMVESGASEVSEEEVVGAIEFGHNCCKKIVAAIRDLQKQVGKEKWTFTPPAINQTLYGELDTKFRASLTDAMNTEKYKKIDSYHKIDALKAEAVASVPEEQAMEAGELFDRLKERIFRDQMLKDKRRPDGRAFDQIRNIDIEVGVLPRTHGSAIFTRGETQALVTCTLGTKEDEQRIELLDPAGDSSKRFMLHYTPVSRRGA